MVGAAGRGLATPLICRTRTCPILYRKNNIFNLCFQLFIKLTCAIDINSFYSAVTSLITTLTWHHSCHTTHDSSRGGVRIELRSLFDASLHHVMKKYNVRFTRLVNLFLNLKDCSTYLFSNMSSWYTLLHLGFYIC